MRNKDFDKLLKEAIILDAEEQGARIEPCSEPIPEAAQARFDAALNGTRKEPKRTASEAPSEQPQPVKRAHRWLAYGLTAVSAAAVVLTVALLIGTGGVRATKAPEPADVQPPQAETTSAPLPEPGEAQPEPEPGGGSNFGPAFILNGKELDVYTEHYFIAGTDDDIPLNAFLSSIGSYYVDSPYNKYQVQCYEIEGIRYIYDWESQVFALAEQYDSVVQAAKTKGRMPTEAEFQAIDLLPAGVEMQADAWLDHSTLESVLRKMGLDITIELDREENAIRVTMSEPEPAETGEPLPYTDVTYRDTEEAEAAMRQLFATFPELIEKVRDELNEPEHRVLKGGVLYVDRGVNAIDWEHPCADTTEAIRRLLQLPGSRYFFAGWERADRVPVFFLTVYWTNETGYYQTSLVFAEDPDYLYANDPAAEDVTPKPLTEDRTWAIYSERWQEAPFEMEPEPTPAPEPEPEPGEPLPNTRVTFADENAAIVAMMHFYEENRTLLMAVAADLKAPEHGYIVNGVVYSINGSYVDRDHPYASMTDSIKAFLDLPDSVDYVLWWNDSVFYVSLRWTNDSGYYSTELVFAEDGQRIVNMMSEEQGTTLEPVYEDSAWGVYTVCWQTAPFHAGSSYAPEQAIGVWETDIYDHPSLYLELFDDGTARILHLFGDYDIRAHYAWDYDRDSIRITFSDQTVVKTAELHINTDTMTLTLADGSTVKEIRAEGVVLPLFASDTGRARNTVALPAVCPAYALGTSKKETVEGILFRYDLDGDGTEETISFRQSPEDDDTPVIISIGETEYPLAELDARDKVSRAILIKPDPASEDLALVVTTDDFMADWNETAILLLHGKEVRKIKAETNDAYAYLQDGTLRITARCWLIGTYYGSRVYAGAELEPESEWYETVAAKRVRELSREEQIEFNWLFKAIRDVPCTIDGKPAVIEPGTWVYLLRWKDTDDCAEIMTEDGRIALLAFTEEYDQTWDMHSYCIDGVDAESYFENLCMAG